MNIAFDLDGTLSDPASGIASSINHALKKLGFPGRDNRDLLKYIGPPLQDIFEDLLGKNDPSLIQSAIALYRANYYRTGFRENIIYPEIKTILNQLSSQKHQLYIATSKKTDVAICVTEYFGITSYFKEILGCGLTRKKYELLNDIQGKTGNGPLLMVGDRSYDMAAGKKANCYCVGVLWGYGTRDELWDSGADLLLNKPHELINIVNDMTF